MLANASEALVTTTRASLRRRRVLSPSSLDEWPSRPEPTTDAGCRALYHMMSHTHSRQRGPIVPTLMRPAPPSLAWTRQNAAEFDRVLAEIGVRPWIDQSWTRNRKTSTSTRPGSTSPRLESAEGCPKSAKFNPSSTKAGPKGAQLDQDRRGTRRRPGRPKLGPDSAKLGPHSARIAPESTKVG